MLRPRGGVEGRAAVQHELVVRRVLEHPLDLGGGRAVLVEADRVGLGDVVVVGEQVGLRPQVRVVVEVAVLRGRDLRDRRRSARSSSRRRPARWPDVSRIEEPSLATTIGLVSPAAETSFLACAMSCSDGLAGEPVSASYASWNVAFSYPQAPEPTGSFHGWPRLANAAPVDAIPVQRQRQRLADVRVGEPAALGDQQAPDAGVGSLVHGDVARGRQPRGRGDVVDVRTLCGAGDEGVDDRVVGGPPEGDLVDLRRLGRVPVLVGLGAARRARPTSTP